jgi:cytoskeletal protein RodZ
MGVIKKLIGGLFAFLGGFLKGLFSLVGIGKKSEYFLEYKDENAQSGANLPAPSTPAKLETAKAEPSKADSAKAMASQAKSANQKSVKPESLNGKAPATTAAPAPAPQPVAVASKTEPGQTFAPNFLITPSSNNGRRRPGPSLNRFMDMAKQVRPSA